MEEKISHSTKKNSLNFADGKFYVRSTNNDVLLIPREPFLLPLLLEKFLQKPPPPYNIVYPYWHFLCCCTFLIVQEENHNPPYCCQIQPKCNPAPSYGGANIITTRTQEDRDTNSIANHSERWKYHQNVCKYHHKQRVKRCEYHHNPHVYVLYLQGLTLSLTTLFVSLVSLR
jgi:hypothetical protein